MKEWFQSKTMLLAFAVSLLGLVQTTLETAPISSQYAGLVTIGIGALIAALRAVTTDAIGSSDEG